MNRATLTSCIVLAFLPGILQAQIIHVPDSIPGIQAAIDTAMEQDTIIVAEGTYFENIDFKGKAITVASEFLLDGDTSHISRTTIDGSQPVDSDTGSVVLMISGEDTTSVLTGFTIAGGTGTYFTYMPYNYHYLTGGGILMAWSGGRIEHNIIEDNHLTEPKSPMAVLGFGIGAFVKDNHTAIIRRNIIRDNSFTGMSHANGAGIGLGGGRIIVDHNLIYNNTSQSEQEALGGGIAYWRLAEDIQPELTISNNRIYDNELNVTGGIPQGGGLYLSGDNLPLDLRVFNNLIYHNKATGGLGGGATFMKSKPIVFNNTILNNEAESGEQLFLTSNADLALFNTIIWEDLDDGKSGIFIQPDEGVQLRAIYNDVKGGLSGEGNIDADPQLNQESFELSETSPCIGSGIASIDMLGVRYEAPVMDYYGHVRPNPVDQYIDMGAIESPFGYPVFSNILHSATDLIVYPNPSEDQISLHLNNPGKHDVKIISLSGQVIHTEVFFGEQCILDLSGVPGGMYLITVDTDGARSAAKVVKR